MSCRDDSADAEALLASPEVSATIHHWAREVLGEVLAVLDRASVPVLPVKGVLTAYALYSKPAERPIRDIDLRVLPEHLPKVLDAARTRGWHVHHVSNAYQAALLRVGGLSVDVETSVGAPFMTRLTVRQMFARASRQSAPFRFSHLRPDFEDHLILQCLNVYKDHLMHASAWAIEDLFRSADMPGFDPQRFLQRVREAGNLTAIHVLASWLLSRRDHAVWQTLLRQTSGHGRKAYARVMLTAVRKPMPETALFLRGLSRLSADDALTRARAMIQLVRFAVAEKPPRTWG